MKIKLIKRPQVSQDIRALALHIARDNLDAALRFIEAAEKTVDKLAELPGFGDHLPNDEPGFENLRACPIRGFEKHLILYLPGKETIDVIRVVHGSRNINRLLG